MNTETELPKSNHGMNLLDPDYIEKHDPELYKQLKEQLIKNSKLYEPEQQLELDLEY